MVARLIKRTVEEFIEDPAIPRKKARTDDNEADEALDDLEGYEDDEEDDGGDERRIQRRRKS